jgi:hypothetical protein
MRRCLTLTACLALMASSTSVAKADPIMGNITLTVTESKYGGLTGGISQPTLAYSSGTVDLSQFFQEQVFPDGSTSYQGLTLNGPLLMRWYGLGDASPPGVTYDMKIAFDGASGSQPTVDVTGSLNVKAVSEPDSASIEISHVWVQTSAILKSATLQGWTPHSGIPMSLINMFLNTSNYQLAEWDQYTVGGRDYPATDGYPPTSTFFLTPDASAVTPVPETATILAYLAAIAGVSVRRSLRGIGLAAMLRRHRRGS